MILSHCSDMFNDVEIISDAFNEYIKEKVITTEDVLTIFANIFLVLIL